MKARVSEPLAASPFFYGPPDLRRRKAGRPQSHLPSQQPEQQPQPAQAWASSAVRGTTYASFVEVGIPSGEPGSYRGRLARDNRATVEACRAGRPQREGARSMKGSSRTFVIVLAMTTIFATVATGAALAARKTSSSSASCAVSPDPVASGTTLTVSGRAGHNGNWVNAYVYYSDGYWGFMGGSVGGGGSFSLSGPAQETHTSFWGPYYPASSGPASVQIYTGSASKNLGMVATCSFTVS